MIKINWRDITNVMQGITITLYVNSITRCKDMIPGLTVRSEEQKETKAQT